MISSQIWQAVVALTIFILLILFRRFATAEVYPDEPPIERPSIPWIGHLIGFSRYGFTYWRSLRSNKPVFTACLLNQKCYVVQHPEWLAAIQRNPNIKFSTLVSYVAETHSDIVGENLAKFYDTPDGKLGMASKTLKDIEGAFGHAHINTANERVINAVSRIIGNEFLSSAAEEFKMGKFIPDLHACFRDIITVATGEALYGRAHPLAEPKVLKALWIFEAHCGVLLANVFRHVIGHKALKARDTIAEAFFKYYRSGGLRDGIELARLRYQLPHNRGLSDEEISRVEVPFLLGIVASAPNAGFFFLFEVLRRPELLTNIRTELEAITEIRCNGKGKKEFHLSMQRLKSECPIMCAAYKETLRCRLTFAPVRTLTEDCTLTDGVTSYGLKKGSTMQLPIDAIHMDERWWDEDAEEFNHKRYLEGRTGNHPMAYRAFGLNPVLCPGRHVATSEIMAAIAQVVMRYDVTPVNGWGNGIQNPRHLSGIAPLGYNLPVHIKPRQDWDGMWKFFLGEGRLKWTELNLT